MIRVLLSKIISYVNTSFKSDAVLLINIFRMIIDISFKFSCVILLFNIIYLFDISSSTASLSLQINRLNKLHFLDPPDSESNHKLVNEEWFEQRLDHFNPQVVDTWPQRYFSR